MNEEAGIVNNDVYMCVGSRCKSTASLRNRRKKSVKRCNPCAKRCNIGRRGGSVGMPVLHHEYGCGALSGTAAIFVMQIALCTPAGNRTRIKGLGNLYSIH